MKAEVSVESEKKDVSQVGDMLCRPIGYRIYVVFVRCKRPHLL